MTDQTAPAGASSAPGRVYVQYGCGLCAPEGWINFDASPRLRFERLPGAGALAASAGKRLFPDTVRHGDITRGLPLADRSVDAIYASHVLEHLSRADVVRALANTFRLLKSGGVFRMIVPDIEWRARRYVEARDRGEDGACDAFIEACNMGVSKRRRGPEGVLRAALGNSGHMWMYDEALMRRLLAEAGFVDIRRAAFGDSGDPMFERVEDRGRFVDAGHAELALTARRP